MTMDQICILEQEVRLLVKVTDGAVWIAYVSSRFVDGVSGPSFKDGTAKYQI